MSITSYMTSKEKSAWYPSLPVLICCTDSPLADFPPPPPVDSKETCGSPESHSQPASPNPIPLKRPPPPIGPKPGLQRSPRSQNLQDDATSRIQSSHNAATVRTQSSRDAGPSNMDSDPRTRSNYPPVRPKPGLPRSSSQEASHGARIPDMESAQCPSPTPSHASAKPGVLVLSSQERSHDGRRSDMKVPASPRPALSPKPGVSRHSSQESSRAGKSDTKSGDPSTTPAHLPASPEPGAVRLALQESSRDAGKSDVESAQLLMRPCPPVNQMTEASGHLSKESPDDAVAFSMESDSEIIAYVSTWMRKL